MRSLIDIATVISCDSTQLLLNKDFIGPDAQTEEHKYLLEQFIIHENNFFFKHIVLRNAFNCYQTVLSITKWASVSQKSLQHSALSPSNTAKLTWLTRGFINHIYDDHKNKFSENSRS